MRVLLVHNDYGRFSGEEQAVQNVASALETHGHEVGWYRKSSVGIGDSVMRKFGALCSGVYSPRARGELEERIDEFRPDTVQVQNLYPYISASILPLLAERRIPVVMRCPNYRLFCPNGLHLSHGVVCERCLGPGREWHCVLRNCESDRFKSAGYALRNAFARLTGMITDNVTMFAVLSEFQKARFMERGIPASRLGILPNIAPEIPGAEGHPPGETVAFVGRVSAEKGIREFIEAARRLPGLKFAVAGAVDDLVGMGLEAPDNVKFSGFLTGQALDDFYRSCRVFVFPSLWYEGFPNVVAHAMAHARVVVASDIGAVPEIVTDGETGVLFPPGDAPTLAGRIEQLMGQPERCREMGLAGLAKARREYSADMFYSALSAIHERALCMSREGVA